MYCEICKNELSEGSKYCSYCGTKQNTSAEPVGTSAFSQNKKKTQKKAIIITCVLSVVAIGLLLAFSINGKGGDSAYSTAQGNASNYSLVCEDGEYIFFSSFDGLYRMDENGQLTTIFDRDDSNAFFHIVDIYSYKNSLFYMKNTYGRADGIYVLDKDSLTDTLLIEVDNTDASYINGIHDTALYYTVLNESYIYDLESNETQKLDYQISSISPNGIYYVNYGQEHYLKWISFDQKTKKDFGWVNGDIAQINMVCFEKGNDVYVKIFNQLYKNNTSAETEPILDQIVSANTDGKYIYYPKSDGWLYRCNLDGSNGEPYFNIAEAFNYNISDGYYYINIISNKIFIAESSGNAVVCVDKSSGEYEVLVSK
ncbi:MAG: zinc ribbon domain-containing protein [Clostridia bacterium]|nr:zinc ribbon domain-containing protein [Clostridia bacterium]